MTTKTAKNSTATGHTFRHLAVLLSLCLTLTAAAQTGLDQTATQIAAQMAPGWNLGNTMEAINWKTSTAPIDENYGIGTETHWQSTKTSAAVIKFVKEQGFKSIRIPCNWMCGHITDAATHTIDPAWLNRVKEVVDYCIDEGLYVVLNDHYDGGWVEQSFTNTSTTTVNKNVEIMKNIWTQIANTFKDYDEHLLFAGLNEPGVDNATKMAALLKYEQAFVDAVRATGGNNAKRVLIVQGPSTDINQTYNLMSTLPTDVIANRLMVEVHYYDPWTFCGLEADASWGKAAYYWGSANHVSTSTHNTSSSSEDAYMKTQLTKMKNKFTNKGIPVYIGEYGAQWRNLSAASGESQDKHNASITFFYKTINTLAMEMGMVPVVWDINSCYQNGTKGTMTVLNRSTRTVFNTPAMDGIKEAIATTRIDNTPAFVDNRAKKPTTGKYNLTGQRVGDTYKGIVVENGKKFVVK